MDICLVDLPSAHPSPRELDAVFLLDSRDPRRVIAVGVVELILDKIKRPRFRQAYLRLCPYIRGPVRTLPRSVHRNSRAHLALSSPGWTSLLPTSAATTLHRRFRSTAPKVVEDLSIGRLPFLPLDYEGKEGRPVFPQARRLRIAEGRRRLATHFRKERSRILIDRKRRETKLSNNGVLTCETCGMSSLELHPTASIAERAFEVHHLVPLHSTPTIRHTTLDDLAVVCANCHRLIHATLPPRSIRQLRDERHLTARATRTRRTQGNVGRRRARRAGARERLSR